MKQFNNFLNYLSAIILFLAVLGFLLLSYNHLKKDEAPKKIVITYSLKKDSITNSQLSNLKKIDSLVKDLKSISNNIQSKQISEIKEGDEKDFFNKFYSIVVAVILVIAGFFGYKNISEIKEKAIDDAKSAAEIKSIEVSEREFNKIFTQQYKAEVMDQATEAFSETFNTEYERIFALFSQLETRITAIENRLNQPPPPDGDFPNDNNNEPINPFDHE